MSAANLHDINLPPYRLTGNVNNILGFFNSIEHNSRISYLCSRIPILRAGSGYPPMWRARPAATRAVPWPATPQPVCPESRDSLPNDPFRSRQKAPGTRNTAGHCRSLLCRLVLNSVLWSYSLWLSKVALSIRKMIGCATPLRQARLGLLSMNDGLASGGRSNCWAMMVPSPLSTQRRAWSSAGCRPSALSNALTALGSPPPDPCVPCCRAAPSSARWGGLIVQGGCSAAAPTGKRGPAKRSSAGPARPCSPEQAQPSVPTRILLRRSGPLPVLQPRSG